MNTEIFHFQQLIDKMQSSGVYLALFSKGWENDPKPLLELGMAIVLDLPIALIVMDDIKVPEHLKKIAVAIEYASTSEAMHEATMKILKDLFPGRYE